MFINKKRNLVFSSKLIVAKLVKYEFNFKIFVPLCGSLFTICNKDIVGIVNARISEENFKDKDACYAISDILKIHLNYSMIKLKLQRLGKPFLYYIFIT